MCKTQVQVLIDRELLSNLIHETSYLVAQARIYGKTEPECRMVSGLLAQVTAAINAATPRSASGKPGLECPICHKMVDDADYWDGDRCPKCRLEGIGRPDLANILLKPEPFILNNVREWFDPFPFDASLDVNRRFGFRRVPTTAHGSWSVGEPAPDAHLESDYEDRTCIEDSEMP